MKLHDLAPPAGATKARRRVGRGIGGKGGKTAGRGMKGQKARSTVPLGFEGGQLPLTQRIPKLRGFKNPFRIEYNVVNLDALDALGADEVTVADPGRGRPGAPQGPRQDPRPGSLSRPVRVSAHAFSQAAADAITAAGGSVSECPCPTVDRRPPVRGQRPRQPLVPTSGKH